MQSYNGLLLTMTHILISRHSFLSQITFETSKINN